MKTDLTQAKLIKISDILCNNIEFVFEKLDVKLYNSSKGYRGECPVHGGDNKNAFLLYTVGHTHIGFWNCTSHMCHLPFKPTLIGFIRGVLSHQKYDWKKRGDKFESFENTIKFISETLKVDINNIEIDHEELEKKKFLSQTRWNVPMEINKIIKRQDVQSRLSISPRYFIERGFSKEVLKKYDVGFCDDPKKEMYKRCVVPVYDEGYNYLVGCLGRSIYDKCVKCNQFHNTYDIDCPKYESPKWKMSKNFTKKDSLYNYWFAKEHVKRSKKIVLVESCGNVWRLEEAGINNAVALFGGELSDGQEFLLEKLGVMNIVIILDGDDAGRNATNRIVERTKDFYNVKPIYLDSGDIADMSIEEIHRDIVPYL